MKFNYRYLSLQGFGCSFFSQGVCRYNKQDVDSYTHKSGDRRAVANDRVDQVACRKHQADDGEDKRGPGFARIICRTAGKNSFRLGEDAHEEHRMFVLIGPVVLCFLFTSEV